MREVSGVYNSGNVLVDTVRPQVQVAAPVTAASRSGRRSGHRGLKVRSPLRSLPMLCGHQESRARKSG